MARIRMGGSRQDGTCHNGATCLQAKGEEEAAEEEAREHIH